MKDQKRQQNEEPTTVFVQRQKKGGVWKRTMRGLSQVMGTFYILIAVVCTGISTHLSKFTEV